MPENALTPADTRPVAPAMNVFDLRNALVGEYGAYTQGFIKIRHPGLKARVDDELRRGAL